jgi:small GTP-binding protein
MSDRSVPLLRVAVVGHTNAGKTSLLRTLTRNPGFGEVSDRPGTTRDVEGCVLLADGRPVLELYDTPGLEDSIALLELIESNRSSRRVDGIDLIKAFLDSEEVMERFAQEAKALRQMLACDVALYVVDARDPVLAKYRDELQILGLCARPVVPVLNFIALPETRVREWRDALARLNMHAVAEFDTVVFDAEGEIRLFEKMRSLLDSYRPQIDALIRHRRVEREQLISASLKLIADLLVDVAACLIPVELEALRQSTDAIEDLKQQVRRREERCVAQLLELHSFRQEDCVAGAIPVEGGAWPTDLFSPQSLQEYGIGGTGGAAAGAMVGLTLDILFHGLSLGAATSIGAAVGAALGAGRLPGKRLLERITGRTNLQVDEPTLQLLAVRQMRLLEALLKRGHAQEEPIRLEGAGLQISATESADLGAGVKRKAAVETAGASRFRAAVKMLRSARGRRGWSRLGPRGETGLFALDSRRDRLVDALAAELGSVRSPMSDER